MQTQKHMLNFKHMQSPREVTDITHVSKNMYLLQGPIPQTLPHMLNFVTMSNPVEVKRTTHNNKSKHMRVYSIRALTCNILLITVL